MARPDPAPTGVGLYERRLRRSAVGRVDPTRSTGPGDDLDEVLLRVAERRVARSGAAGRRGDAAAATRMSKGDAVRVAVRAIEQLGPTLRLIRVARPPGFDFRAGQHVKAGVPGVGRRSFSLASAPHEDHLELCVGLQPSGRVTPALFGLQVGDDVELVARAKGSFVLDDSAQVHLMVATSTGIAPLRSMLLDAVHRGVAGRVVVLHGATLPERLAYRAELEALASGAAPVEYSVTVTGSGGRRVDALAVERAAALDPATTVVYACGHPGMVDAVRASFGVLGFTVRSEKF